MRVKNIFSHNDLNFISQFSFPEIVNQGDYNNKKKNVDLLAGIQLMIESL